MQYTHHTHTLYTNKTHYTHSKHKLHTLQWHHTHQLNTHYTNTKVCPWQDQHTLTTLWHRHTGVERRGYGIQAWIVWEVAHMRGDEGRRHTEEGRWHTEEGRRHTEEGRRHKILLPVELEGVGAVAVGGVLIQVTRQVDDVDCLKRTFLKTTQTTTRWIHLHRRHPNEENVSSRHRPSSQRQLSAKSGSNV